MSVKGVQGQYVYTPTRYRHLATYAPEPVVVQPQQIRSQLQAEEQPVVQRKKRKVGFFEGVKAFFKGLVKPVVNMVKHIVPTLIGIAAITALIIGTGGAATPFLIAAGIGLGGFQVGRGIVNALNSKSREETLAALEDIGEGTFSIAASAIGAKNYAAGLKSTAVAGKAASTAAKAGSAAAKATKPTMLTRTSTYLKDMYHGSVQAFKDSGKSLKTTYSMVKSGEFSGNLKSAYGSAKFAWRKNRLKGSKSKRALKKLNSDQKKFNRELAKKANAVRKSYEEAVKNIREETSKANAKIRLDAEKRARAAAKRSGKEYKAPDVSKKLIKAEIPEYLKPNFKSSDFVRPKSWAALKKSLMPRNNVPELLGTWTLTNKFSDLFDDSASDIEMEQQRQMALYMQQLEAMQAQQQLINRYNYNS